MLCGKQYSGIKFTFLQNLEARSAFPNLVKLFKLKKNNTD